MDVRHETAVYVAYLVEPSTYFSPQVYYKSAEACFQSGLSESSQDYSPYGLDQWQNLSLHVCKFRGDQRFRLGRGVYECVCLPLPLQGLQ